MTGKLVRDIGSVAVPEIERLSKQIADDFLGGLSDVLKDAAESQQEEVKAILQEGAKFKWKALTADDAAQARQYAEAVETSVRRVKTILLAEEIVAEEKLAAVISRLWGKALDGLAVIAQGLLTTVVKGIVQGAVSGFTGGEGGDSNINGIFHFS